MGNWIDNPHKKGDNEKYGRMWYLVYEKTRLKSKDTFWYSADVKADGCIEFVRFFNEPLPMTSNHPQLYDQIHICDIDETIKILQELKEKIKDFID